MSPFIFCAHACGVGNWTICGFAFFGIFFIMSSTDHGQGFVLFILYYIRLEYVDRVEVRRGVCMVSVGKRKGEKRVERSTRSEEGERGKVLR